jgi:uncharacterized protein
MEFDHLAPFWEWPDRLDVAALLTRGHRPQPFRQFVLKLTARCDLACDYCYVFAMADQTWRTRPARMSRSLLAAAIRRIREHVERHGLDGVQVVLHGGEPLLAGADLIDDVARSVRAGLPPDVHVDLRMQTNGLLLDRHLLGVLAAQRIRVGVSLDGDREGHDRHRRTADDRGSHAAVDAALRLLTRHHPELFGGLLATIALENDPVTTYEALLAYRPPAVDLLLPLGTWADPPPRWRPDGSAAPYGEWLAAVFDRWYPVARRETTMRFLAGVIHLLLGAGSQVESLGLGADTIVVIDTEGSIEQVDTLRSTRHGAAGMGLTVQGNTLDEALLHPGTVARQLGAEGLCATCRACTLVQVCGGGYYPHRYRPGTGFLNPSVYCRDLQYLISHVHARLAADLAAAGARQAG